MNAFKKLLTIALCVLILSVSLVAPAYFDLVAPAYSGLVAPVYAGDASVIRIGVSGRMEPLMFVDDKGEACGIFVDLMDAVASDAGYRAEYVIYNAHREALFALESGEVDAVLGVQSSELGSFASITASDEIYGTSVRLVMAHQPGPSSSVNVGAYELGTVSDNHVELLGTAVVTVFPTQHQVYDSLVSGQAACVIAIPECVSYLLRQDRLENNYTIGVNDIAGLSYCVGLDASNVIIESAVNKAIGHLRASGKYAQIIRKWGVYTELDEAKKTTKLVGIVAGVVLLVTLVIIAFNMRLRQMVRSKTADLSEKIEDLENSSNLRNTLIEHSGAGSMVLRLDGTILLMNDTMRRIAGLSPDEALPNVSRLGVIARAWDLAPADMEQPELISETGPDGKIRTYRYLNARTSNRDERVFMIEDVTHEEMERQEVFEESKNKALNRIIAGIAHEVKNPLTTIRTYASLAETETGDPEFLQAFTEYVPREVDRISDLIETLVNYSRPVCAEKERFSAGEVAQSCRSLAFVYAKKIEISTDIDESLTLYMGKDQYRQVLINFLLNAIQSVEEKMEKGGSGPMGISLRIFREDNKLDAGDTQAAAGGSLVVTEVSDSGVGMTDDQLRQCTEPFFTTKKKGTGMGLALARQFINENGGRFEIESKEGVGTTVRMIFAEDKDDE